MKQPEHALPERTYYLVFAGLILLTLLTVGVSYVPLGILHGPVGLLIAVCKAALVLLFFMHVIHSTRLTWVMALSGLFWLAIMFSLTLSDYLTRNWLPVPGH